jgi:hypothetical protein
MPASIGRLVTRSYGHLASGPVFATSGPEAAVSGRADTRLVFILLLLALMAAVLLAHDSVTLYDMQAPMP